MVSDAEDNFEDEAMPANEWDEFRDGEGVFIGLAELKQLDLPAMPEDVRIPLLDNYFPETTLWRDGDSLVCQIQEHLYTRYWEHKFSAYAFADAMLRSVRRLAHEGHPLSNPSRDNDDDVHIFVRWELRVPRGFPGAAPSSPSSIRLKPLSTWSGSGLIQCWRTLIPSSSSAKTPAPAWSG